MSTALSTIVLSLPSLPLSLVPEGLTFPEGDGTAMLAKAWNVPSAGGPRLALRRGEDMKEVLGLTGLPVVDTMGGGRSLGEERVAGMGGGGVELLYEVVVGGPDDTMAGVSASESLAITPMPGEVMCLISTTGELDGVGCARRIWSSSARRRYRSSFCLFCSAISATMAVCCATSAGGGGDAEVGVGPTIVLAFDAELPDEVAL
jgi:hypothetical protein